MKEKETKRNVINLHPDLILIIYSRELNGKEKKNKENHKK